MPYSQSVAVRCKLEDVKLISGSIQWATGGQCGDWHFMPLTRRSTEGILDVVSEQTSHGPDKIGSRAGPGPRAASCTWLV